MTDDCDPPLGGESATKRDGLLSHPAEWHSVVHGVSDGTRSLALSPRSIPADPCYLRNQIHYYKTGYLLGTVLQFFVLAALFRRLPYL